MVEGGGEGGRLGLGGGREGGWDWGQRGARKERRGGRKGAGEGGGVNALWKLLHGTGFEVGAWGARFGAGLRNGGCWDRFERGYWS